MFRKLIGVNGQQSIHLKSCFYSTLLSEQNILRQIYLKKPLHALLINYLLGVLSAYNLDVDIPATFSIKEIVKYCEIF